MGGKKQGNNVGNRGKTQINRSKKFISRDNIEMDLKEEDASLCTGVIRFNGELL